MTHSPFSQMQAAVDIVNDSAHPVNKIAAAIYGQGPDGVPFSHAYTNYWPDVIREKIGTDVQIGNSSGTIHAETACILRAPQTLGAALCITDPFCPNCAKNMAEAGIQTVYIDHKGFDKDFAARRGGHFERMSMRICERAGMAVYKINRKAETLTPILEVAADFEPHEDSPVDVTPWPDANFAELVSESRRVHYGRNYACALAKNVDGDVFALTARAHVAVGFDIQADNKEIKHPESKYSFLLEPVNRLLMNAPRHGLKLIGGAVYAARVPTSRELVNMVGAGLTELTVGNMDEARDDHALAALSLLQDRGIINFICAS